MIFDNSGAGTRAGGTRTNTAGHRDGDLDKFKSINDTFGHPAGDAVLQQASRRLQACVRSYDHVGRYGGEEFLIVMLNCDREKAIKVSERLRQSVADSPMIVKGKELNITCSLGVAFTDTSNGTRVAVLVQAADEALYSAKQAGRNCIKVAP
jgi:two-component system cell cycle response regulator